MVLNEICPPALIYLIFSITQISIDSFKGQYNTAFAKIWVALVFTIVLNYLCSRGLGIISWFIVFIPFVLMTLIISILLYVFGLDPSTGRLKIYAPPAQFQQDITDYRQLAIEEAELEELAGAMPYYNHRDNGRTNEYARGGDRHRDRNNNGYPSNIGGQTDAHGCLKGAGYSWCKPLKQCIGPGIECAPSKNIGGQTDAHGCLKGAGYSWCKPLKQCIGPGIECAPSKNIGGQTDAHGCLKGAGYSWCSALGKCVGPGDPCRKKKKKKKKKKEGFSWPTITLPTVNMSAPLLSMPSMSMAADIGDFQMPWPTAISFGQIGAPPS